MPEATGEQEVASPLGTRGEGLHARRAHGNGQRFRQPFRCLDQLRREGSVFCAATQGASNVPTPVNGHVMIDRPRLGLVNTPPNTVSPQPGLDNRPLGLAEVGTP